MGKVGFAVIGCGTSPKTTSNILPSWSKRALLSSVQSWCGSREQFGHCAQPRRAGVTLFSSYDQLLQAGKGFVDIITLPVAIHTHYQLAKDGLEAGYNLVLEKPPVPTVQQLDELIKVEQESGRFVTVGFQMIHSRSLRRLKSIILEGRLGQLTAITCRGYWPRTDGYYRRNNWAGKLIVDGSFSLGWAHAQRSSPLPEQHALHRRSQYGQQCGAAVCAGRAVPRSALHRV